MWECVNVLHCGVRSTKPESPAACSPFSLPLLGEIFCFKVNLPGAVFILYEKLTFMFKDRQRKMQVPGPHILRQVI